MRTDYNQRWLFRESRYRPAAEPIDTRQYEVAEIGQDRLAKAFVVAHHYSATYPAARYRFGLHRGAQLVGVAVFSHPVNDRVLSVFPGAAVESVELGRFVLLDDVPGNGETWFLGRCFEVLRRKGLLGVLSFSDPVPRASTTGRVVHPGHVGTIYQAHNAVYLGRGAPRLLRLLPSGRVLSPRAIQKVRALERGWRYAAALLETEGAPLAPPENAKAWLAQWLPLLTRPLRHPGNHRYAWVLQRRLRRHLPRSFPYPKLMF